MPKRRANGEGSIFERKDKNGKKTGLWAAQYTDNTGKKRTLYGKSQQEVRLKMKEAINQSDMGLQIDKGKISLAEWMEEWLEVYCRPNVRESSYSKAYDDIHKHIIPAFQNVLLKNLSPNMLQKFFNEKAKSGRLDGKDGRLSLGTLSATKTILVQALNKAVENKIITENEAKKVRLPRRMKSEVKVLTVDEQKKLEEAIAKNSNPLSFGLLLSLYTGLRIGELTGLKINDIDFATQEITVRRSIKRISIPGTNHSKKVISQPKTSKGQRVIPINDNIMIMLKNYITERNYVIEIMKSQWGDGWSDEGFLFVSRQGTTPDRTTFAGLLNRILRETGLKHIKVHTLRHTFATRCIEIGFDIKSLSDILGHSNASMTLNTYTHALSDQKRYNMNKLTPFINTYKKDE